jgi:outer membrane lipoprotein-sorting protein
MLAPIINQEDAMTPYPHHIRMFAACLCLFAFASVTHAQELKTAQEIMDFSTTKSADYKTWSADYTQTMSMMGSQMNVSGRMIQKQPRKMWMQMDMPMMGEQGKMTMVMGTDGILWQVMDMGPQHQIMKIDMNKIASNSTGQAGAQIDPIEQMDPSKQWAASRQMFDFTVAKPQQIDGQPMYVMQGHWKQAALTNQQTAMAAAMIGSSRVFIGQKDGFLHRMEQFDKSGTNLVMAMEFKNLKFNDKVPDSTFVYQPPANAQVTDMTPMVEMQMRARTSAQTTPPPTAKPSPATPAAPPKEKPATP